MKVARQAMALLLLLAAAPAHAASGEVPGGDASPLEQRMQDAQEMIRNGIAEMMGTLADLLRQMPRYEMPRLDGNGDIIIKRKHPVSPAPEEGAKAI